MFGLDLDWARYHCTYPWILAHTFFVVVICFLRLSIPSLVNRSLLHTLCDFTVKCLFPSLRCLLFALTPVHTCTASLFPPYGLSKPSLLIAPRCILTVTYPFATKNHCTRSSHCHRFKPTHVATPQVLYCQSQLCSLTHHRSLHAPRDKLLNDCIRVRVPLFFHKSITAHSPRIQR